MSRPAVSIVASMIAILSTAASGAATGAVPALLEDAGWTAAFPGQRGSDAAKAVFSRTLWSAWGSFDLAVALDDTADAGAGFGSFDAGVGFRIG